MAPKLDEIVRSHYDGAWDILPAAVVVVTPEGELAYVNSAAARLLGRNREDVIGQPAVTVLEPHNEDGATWIRNILSDRSAWAGTVALKTPSGRTLELAAATAPLLHGGRPLGIVGVLAEVEVTVRAYALLGDRPPFDEARQRELSEEEARMLKLVAQGLTNKEIAMQLHFSLYTVRDTLSALMVRYRVRNRDELAVMAVALGVADISTPPAVP